MELNQLRVN